MTKMKTYTNVNIVRCTYIVPSDKQFISQSMGIFLTSKSCEMIMGCTEFGKIEDHLDD